MFLLAVGRYIIIFIVSLTQLFTADIDASVGFLMQIDKLVQLLESPIFIRILSTLCVYIYRNDHAEINFS